MGDEDSSERPGGQTGYTRRDVLKWTTQLGAAAALAPLYSACGGSADSDTSPPATSSSPVKGGTLRVGLSGASGKEHLDPHETWTNIDICRISALYEPLTTRDPDLQAVPCLAEELIPLQGGKVWQFRIREGVEFHNGKTVTADDVIFSLQRILDPKNPRAGSASLMNMTVDGFKKLDERTVEATLTAPVGPLEDGLAAYLCGIVPTDFDLRNPVGTGPFKFKSLEPGQQSVFVRNENYWDVGPYADELRVLSFADDAALVNAFLTGEVDVVGQIPRAQVEPLKSQGFHILQSQTAFWLPIQMRVDVRPFDDPRVREAFKLIADREEIVNLALDGLGFVGNDIYCPFDPGYPTDLPQREQDIEKAKALLKEAGYEGLSQEMVVTPATSGMIEACQVFAEQAKKAGVTIRIRKVDPGIYYGDDFLKWHFNIDYYNSRNYLGMAAQITLPGAPYNETHWEDPEWIELATKAMATPDDIARNELVRQAMIVEHERGGQLVWGFCDNLDAFSENVKGMKTDKGLPLMNYQLNEVWLA